MLEHTQLLKRERERERDRQTDRQTDRDKERTAPSRYDGAYARGLSAKVCAVS